jgi:glycosyltransferase involved in cell wall biosynthesis
VVVSTHLPYRTIPHAGGRFSFAWLSALSRFAEVHLVVPASPDNDPSRNDLPSSIETTVVAPLVPQRRVAARAHQYRLGGITPGLAVLEGLRRSDRLWRAVSSADVVELHWQHLLPLVTDLRSRCPDTPITACVHDVMTQKAQREADGASRWRTRRGSSVRARIARVVEPRLLGHVDHVFTFSTKDVQLLRAMGVTVPASVVDPPVSVPDVPARPPARPVVTFTGAMSRPVNAESIRWFLAEVWPEVATAVNGVTLVIAGARPPSWLTGQGDPTVVVTGEVDDLDAIYRDSSVFVAPLRMGAGVKFKVLDAMAFGLPVVATPIAAEGIVDEAGGDCFAAITADPVAMAASIVAILREPELGMEPGRRARAWVHDRFDFERSVQRGLAVYEGLSARRSAAVGPP